MTDRILIFGAGYSGKAIAGLALAEGASVAGTTRSEEKEQTLTSLGMDAFVFDGSAISPGIATELERTTHLVVSIAPDHGMRDGDRPAATPEEGSCDPVLAAAGTAIAERMPALRWIGYLSTIGVYGDHGGAWIDEESRCEPRSRRSRMRLEAERQWLALSARTGIPVAILRLSGIYGPGRNGFVNLENGTARRIVKQGQVFNRIHVDDIAAATLHLARRRLGGVFNVTDDEPAPAQDVVAFAASLMGVEPPPEIDFEAAEMTPMARSFYGENKRASNAKLKSAAYSFIHPDYRRAFRHMWEKGDWRGGRPGAEPRSKIGS